MNPQWPYSRFSVPPPSVPVTYQSPVLQQSSWSPVNGNPIYGYSQTADDRHKPPTFSDRSSVSEPESVFNPLMSAIPFTVPPPVFVSTKFPPPTLHSKCLSNTNLSLSSTLPAELSPPLPSALPPPLPTEPPPPLPTELPLSLPSVPSSLPSEPPSLSSDPSPSLPPEHPPLLSEHPPSIPSGSLSLLKNEVRSSKSITSSVLSNKLPVKNCSTSELSVSEESVKVPEKIEPSVTTSLTNESKTSIINESLNPAQIHFSSPELSKQSPSVSSPIVASNNLSSNSIKDSISDISNQCSVVQSTSIDLQSFNSSSVRHDQPLQTVLPSFQESAYPFIQSTSASQDMKSTLVNTSASQDDKSTLVDNSSKDRKQTCSVAALSQSTVIEAQKSSLSPTVETVLPVAVEVNKSLFESGSVEKSVPTAVSFSTHDPAKIPLPITVGAAVSSAAQYPVPAVIQASLPLLQIPPQVPLQAAVPPPLSVQPSHASFMLSAPIPSMPVAPHFHLGAVPDLSKGNLLVPATFNTPPPVRIHPSYLSFPVPGSVLQTGTPYSSYTSQATPNEYKRMPDLWNNDQSLFPSSSMERLQIYSENECSSSKDGAEEYLYSDKRYHSPSNHQKRLPLSAEKEHHFVSNRRHSSVSKEGRGQSSFLRHDNHSSPERHKNNSSRNQLHSVSKDSRHNSSSKESRHHSPSEESKYHTSSEDYRCSVSKEIKPNSCTRESRHRSPTRGSRHRSPTRKSRHCSPTRKSRHRSPTRKSRHCSPTRKSRILSPTREFKHHSVAHEHRNHSPVKDRKHHSSGHSSRHHSPAQDKRHHSTAHNRRQCSLAHGKSHCSSSSNKHHSSSHDHKPHSSSHDHGHSFAHDHSYDLSSINHRHHSQSGDYKCVSPTKKHLSSSKKNNLFCKDSKYHSHSKEQNHHSSSVEIRNDSSPKQSISLPVEDQENNSSFKEPKCDSLVKEGNSELSSNSHAHLNDLDKNKQNNQDKIDNNSEGKNILSENTVVKPKKDESKPQSENDSHRNPNNRNDRSFKNKSVSSIQKQKTPQLHSAKSPKKRKRSTSLSTKSPKKRKDDHADSVTSCKRRSSQNQRKRSSEKQSSQKRGRRSSRNSIHKSRSNERLAHRRDRLSNRRKSHEMQHSRNDKKNIRFRRRRSSTPKDLPCLSLKAYKYVCSNLAEEYYCFKENSMEVIAKDALKKLHEKFRYELVERAERIRASKPKYDPPKRKTKLRKPKPPKTGSDSDSSSSEEKSSSDEEDTAMEELERKKKHPYRLHLELWFNDPKEMNDGPLCRCSAKARRAGIRHGIYVGEEHLPLCEPLSNNKNRLYHYRITMTPHTNFLTKNPTTIRHNGHEYRFEGFSMFSHSPLPQLPNCKVIRFNYEYTILYKEEDFPQNFTIGGLELFNSYLLNEILELVDLNWKAFDDPEGCPRFHFMPRFSRELKDGGKELLSHCYVLEYLLKANQILVDDKKLPEILELDNHKWQDLADEVKGMIVTCPGMKPTSIRVDQLDREQCETDKHEFPVIVHFGVRPPQLSYAGNPYYQKAWRDYVKYRHLLANKPKVKYADRHKLMQKESRLQEMRMENDLKRDVTVVISSKNFYKTGIMSDIVQHAMLVPVLVCHLRFHDSLTHLENKIGYKFEDRYLLQLALTHPSYRENFGTNPDHARNSLTNCGLRQPQYGDRRIHYMNTRKRGINTLINIMSRFGSRKETLSRINHNERLEFLGDAVVEFLSSIHLFYMFPDLEEGGLATYRAAIVQNQHLAVLSKKLELDRFMLYAHGSDLCHDLELRHAMANCFEALMGALFLDNGIEIADKVFSKTLFTELELLEVWKNFPPHPLQEQEPNGDRKWIDSVPLLQNLHKFEEAIGIEFNHIRLLARALTHRSLGYNNLTLGSNQRLEFLGDTVLQLVASEYLYKFFPEHHEGHLSLLRSSLVNNRTQAVVCADLGMVQFAIYPYSKVELKSKDKADLLEAFLGALYVDKDLGYCRKFCEVCFFPRLQDFIMNQDWNDPKSKLQQCCLTLRSMDGGEPDIPTYKVIECKGPTNTRVYSVAVYFQGNRLAVGSGHSIQQAEMDAAANALKKSKDLFPQLRHQRRAIERSLKKGPPKKHQDSSKGLS